MSMCTNAAPPIHNKLQYVHTEYSDYAENKHLMLQWLMYSFVLLQGTVKRVDVKWALIGCWTNTTSCECRRPLIGWRRSHSTCMGESCSPLKQLKAGEAFKVGTATNRQLCQSVCTLHSMYMCVSLLFYKGHFSCEEFCGMQSMPLFNKDDNRLQCSGLLSYLILWCCMSNSMSASMGTWIFLFTHFGLWL